MQTYRCPVCKKPLTKKEYEQALGILGEREKHLQHEKAKLQRNLQEAKARAKKAREEGIRAERGRTQILLAGKEQEKKRTYKGSRRELTNSKKDRHRRLRAWSSKTNL